MKNKSAIWRFLRDLATKYKMEDSDVEILYPIIESSMVSTKEARDSRDQWKKRYYDLKERMKEALKEPVIGRRKEIKFAASKTEKARCSDE